MAQIENLNGILVRLGNGLFVAAFSIKQAQNSVLSIYSAAGAIVDQRKYP